MTDNESAYLNPYLEEFWAYCKDRHIQPDAEREALWLVAWAAGGAHTARASEDMRAFDAGVSAVRTGTVRHDMGGAYDKGVMYQMHLSGSDGG